MYILGLHTSHDTSACLLKDGEIVVAIEKERLHRYKHYRGNNDLQGIVDYCLESEKINLSDIKYIVVNDINNIFNKTVFSEREYAISHHLAHAWAAAGLSPFEESAIMILDGEGSKVIELCDEERSVCNYNIDFFAEKESCYQYKDNTIQPLKKWTSGRGGDSNFSGTDATGSPYWILSQHFFNKEHQEAKIMGLASYGKKDKDFLNVFNLVEDGGINIDKQWIFKLKDIPSNDLDNNIHRYAGIAATIQSGTEDAILHKAKWLKEVCNTNNLCFSGGIALNCVANAKLANSKVFKNTFIPFGAGDSSIAIGCAFYGWHILAKQGKNKSSIKISPYLGKKYSEKDIEDTLNNYLLKDFIKFEKQENYIENAAKQLYEGKIIAWFQGRSEFGPRALGNRSIFANPGIKGIRDVLNKKVKFRESFRPFAPAILIEYTEEWFESFLDSTYYMQFIANVKENKRDIISEVTHIDNTARIQTVSKDINPVFHDLINQFSKLSGIPILLNTSFNIQEPIVESPIDAILTFITSSIDSLYIEDFHVKSLVEIVKDRSFLDKNCFIIGHKNIQLQYTPPNKYSIQILDGIENTFRFGDYYQISNFNSTPISKILYNFLANKKIQRGIISELSEDEIFFFKDNYEDFKEFILDTRIISIIRKKQEC